ncbi:hypothetical protein FO470_14205 [Starkeya sp. 3C]|uniref:Uncharacterized protein n=1 Tax=Ancylobacter moscoviensis TaxID=2597768 RepID=A0ABY3DPU7_9HYPH|nr:hypothetical protein [Ancylobacter moscoviensis]TSJ61618.1 hypothetical protein FO470_14205 [Ancylobacter moscoviensis]
MSDLSSGERDRIARLGGVLPPSADGVRAVLDLNQVEPTAAEMPPAQPTTFDVLVMMAIVPSRL